MSVTAPPSPRERILAATVRLLAEGGTDAVSTRAVGEAARVQAPTIYRLFGDKQGLLDAAVDQGIGDYLARKRERAWPDDPIESFRTGWDEQIALALDNPALYRLMLDAWHRRSAESGGFDLLRRRIEALARAGLLRTPVEAAARLTHATGTGVALDLIGADPAERDPDLSARAREAVLAAITAAAAPEAAPTQRAALTLLAHLGDASSLTAAERALLAEWLGRIADDPSDTASSRT